MLNFHINILLQCQKGVLDGIRESKRGQVKIIVVLDGLSEEAIHDPIMKERVVEVLNTAHSFSMPTRRYPTALVSSNMTYSNDNDLM